MKLFEKKRKPQLKCWRPALKMSRETIRSDLSQLAKQGKVQKVHGGAIAPSVLAKRSFNNAYPRMPRQRWPSPKPQLVCSNPERPCIIDTGSTTLFFAEEIARIGGVTIITNSAEIARTIAKANNGHHVFLLGGEYSTGNSQTIGVMVTAKFAFSRPPRGLTVSALGPGFDRLSGTRRTPHGGGDARIDQLLLCRIGRAPAIAGHGIDGAVFQVRRHFALPPNKGAPGFG